MARNVPLHLQHKTRAELAHLKKSAVKIARYARENDIEAIVGIDVGGRGAALLVRHVYGQLYGKPIKTQFIQPAKEEHNVVHFAVPVTKGARVLLVDECVAQGGSMKRLKAAFEKKGASVLGAAFGATSPKSSKFADYIANSSMHVHFPRNYISYWGDMYTGLDTIHEQVSPWPGVQRRSVPVAKSSKAKEVEKILVGEYVKSYRNSLKQLAAQAVEEYGRKR